MERSGPGSEWLCAPRARRASRRRSLGAGNQQRTFAVVLALWLVESTSDLATALDIGTAFTYQGHLENANGPVTDTCDFRFGLWDAAAGGNQAGNSPQLVGQAVVTGGNFSVALDFGPAALDGTARWLAIEVRCGGDNDFVPLNNPPNPRMELTPSPHALRAVQGVGPPGAVNVTPGGNVGIGMSSPATKLDVLGSIHASVGISAGNTINVCSPTSTLRYISSDAELEFYVADPNTDCSSLTGADRVLRLEPEATSGVFTASNVIAGWHSNSTLTGIVGATIAGGGGDVSGTDTPNSVGGHFGTVAGGYGNNGTGPGSAVSGGFGNEAGGVFSVIGGGRNNTSGGQDATVAGGQFNDAGGDDSAVGGGIANTSSGMRATVGGGYDNEAAGFQSTVSGGAINHASAESSTIGGGLENQVSGQYGAVGGGAYNQVSAECGTIGGGCSDKGVAPGNRVSDEFGTVGGGGSNVAGDLDSDALTAAFATVAGGDSNQASGPHSSVGGGLGNIASGSFATIPGGFANRASGVGSFAAGIVANAVHDGTFVWSDSTSSLTSTAPNQFLIRATGGVGIGTNALAAGSRLHVSGADSGVLRDPQITFENNGDNSEFREVSVNFQHSNGKGAEIAARREATDDDGMSLVFRVQPGAGGAAQERMRLSDLGFLGVGDSTPDAPLDVNANSAVVAKFNRLADDGAVIDIEQAGVVEGTISVSGTTVSYNAFTGSHYAWTEEHIERGTLVAMTGQNRRRGADPRVEPTYGVASTTKANDPTCLGAYLGLLEPAQVQSAENPHQIMAVGNGDMWVVNSGRDIQPGDYLISSDVRGHAMLDDLQRFPVGYVIARAAEPVAWSRVADKEPTSGRKHQRISVFFESFARGAAAVDSARIGQLEAELSALQSQVAVLKAQLRELISKDRSAQ